MKDDCNFHRPVYAMKKHNSSKSELFALKIQEHFSRTLDVTLTIHET